MRTCTTHHYACACREAKATMDMALLRAENQRLREALDEVWEAFSQGDSVRLTAAINGARRASQSRQEGQPK